MTAIPTDRTSTRERVTIAGQAEADPVIDAFEAWRCAYIAWMHAGRAVSEVVGAIPAEMAARMDAAYRDESAALDRLIAARPTSATGVALHMRMVIRFYMEDFVCDDLPADPANWCAASLKVSPAYRGSFEERAVALVASVMAGVDAMAGRA